MFWALSFPTALTFFCKLTLALKCVAMCAIIPFSIIFFHLHLDSSDCHHDAIHREADYFSFTQLSFTSALDFSLVSLKWLLFTVTFVALQWECSINSFNFGFTLIKLIWYEQSFTFIILSSKLHKSCNIIFFYYTLTTLNLINPASSLKIISLLFSLNAHL
jgi:hypothetical protein